MKRKRPKIFSLIAYLLFGALSSLIIAESAVPSDASGKQSFSFSSIVANIMNALMPPKVTVTANPTSIAITPSLTTGKTADGQTVYLFDADEAIVGTTRAFTYTLSYDVSNADVFNSSITCTADEACENRAYSQTISPSSKKGTVRIIPLEEGFYSFTVKDVSGNEGKIQFTAKERIAPRSIETTEETFVVKKGDRKVFPFALSFPSMKRSDGSVDHYVARYHDPDLVEFTSSDESIFTVEKGGLISGVSEGEADLLFQEEVVGHIKIDGEATQNDIASITLESEKPCISPLDYDYSGYGSQLTPHFFDVNGDELEFEETPELIYTSSSPLVGMVRNDHLEQTKEGLVKVGGGFVMGYRNLGSATITASLANNPEIKGSIEVESRKVEATSASLSFIYSSKAVASGASIVAGNTISIKASLQPANCANKNIHVDVSDTEVATINNNNSTSPTISLVNSGNLTLSCYAVALGEESKIEISIVVTPRPVIDDASFSDFATFFRKFAGHFLLFLFTGLMGSIALLTSIPRSKKGLVNLSLVNLLAGFSLAGISEAIQAIPSLRRGSSWLDIGIDTLGYFIGVLLVFLVIFIIWIIKERRKKKND